ncbi:MAG: hypothetical protein V7750_06330 [Sneathiella sp.]
MTKLLNVLKDISIESFHAYWGLFKIMAPVMVIVEIGIRFGVVDIVSKWCEPVMSLVGLPAETGLILATNIIVGLYGAGAALVALSGDLTLTVANMTVLGGMLLFAHSLPIEQTIVKKTGVSVFFSTVIRLFAAILYAWICHLIFSSFDIFNDPADILIATGTSTSDGSWFEWIKSSALGLFWVFWILFFLISMLRIMDATGITRFLTRILTPGLKFLGIGPNAAPLTMIGIMLGLSFGGGLIIREIKKGGLKPKSIFLSMIFMCLCHSLIEDTLIIMAFGGHWSGVLVGRIFISFLLILPVSFAVMRMSDKTFYRYLFVKPK